MTVLLALAVGLWTAPAGAGWQEGVAAFQKKNYTAAVKEFQKVTKTNPDFAGGYYMLGLAQSQLGQVSQGLGNLKKAVKLDGKNAQYRTALGQLLLRAKQYNDAYETLKAVDRSKLRSGEKSFYTLLFAGAATKANRPQEAVRSLEAQIRRDPKNGRLFQALGVAYASQGNDAKAATAFAKAYSLNPSNTAMGKSAAYAAIAAGRRTRSSQQKVTYYTQAARIAEKLARSHSSFEYELLAGESWLGAKRFEQALSWLDRAKAKKPQSSLVRFYRGQCYSSLHRFTSAATELESALKYGPEGKLRRQIYNQLGYVYAKQKQYGKAITAYQSAGNSVKMKEMQANLKKQKHNLAADQEQREFARKIKALLLQAQELEKLGQVDEAKALRDQVRELQKSLRKK